MTPIAGHDRGDGGLGVGGVASLRDTPPAVARIGEVGEHLAGEIAEQVPLVLEVDVEAGP